MIFHCKKNKIYFGERERERERERDNGDGRWIPERQVENNS